MALALWVALPTLAPAQDDAAVANPAPANDTTTPDAPAPTSPEPQRADDEPATAAATNTGDGAAAEPAPPSPIGDGISRYQAELQQLEAQYGAYDPALQESLLGLGLAYQMEGNHEQAIKYLLRAVHVDRVNKGLYDAGRIPLLQRLIGSYVATEDWQAVDDGYFNMMQLYSRNYSPMDKALLPGLGQMVNWHLYAFEANVTEDPLRNLGLARHMLQQSVAIVEKNYGPTSPLLLDALNGMVLTDYYLALAQTRQEAEAMQFSSDPFHNDPLDRAAQAWDPYLQPFNEGKRHIEQMIAIAEQNQPDLQWRLLDAKVMLADWNMLYGRRTDAQEIYGKVWEQGSTLENGAAWLAEKFAEPVALPSFRFSDSARDQAVNESAADRLDRAQDLGEVVLQFDVSTTGLPTNIEVVESRPQAGPAILRKAKGQLKETRFRPKQVDGVAVAATAATSRYVFEPDADSTPASVPETAAEPADDAANRVAEVGNVE